MALAKITYDNKYPSTLVILLKISINSAKHRRIAFRHTRTIYQHALQQFALQRFVWAISLVRRPIWV